MASSVWRSTIWRLTWKPSATRSGRVLCRLAASVPSTSATGSGSPPALPTPQTPSGGRVWPKGATVEGNTARTPDGRKVQVHLHHIAEGRVPLPTPTAENFESNDVDRFIERRAECAERHGNNGFGLTLGRFAAIARWSWPTPRHEGFDAGGHRGTADSLHSAAKEVVRAFPTPRAIYGEHPGMTDPKHLTGAALAAHAAIGTPTASPDDKLNPEFVEAMMGYPLGWTLPEGDPLRFDPDWGGDPLAAFGGGLEFRVPLVAPSGPNRGHRLRAMGNALVPQIPHMIFRAIEHAEREAV